MQMPRVWRLLLALVAWASLCQAAPYGPAVVYLQSVASAIPGLQSLTPVPWSTTETFNCSVPWTGVTCLPGDTYLEVDISNRGLTGTFPGLSYFADGIVRWNSSRNYLSGLIPNPIAVQSSNSPLVSLDVSYNNHTGFHSDPGTSSRNDFIQYYDASENPTIVATASAVYLWRYPNIKVIKCRNCGITGAWPTSSWQFTAPIRPVEVVDFSHNFITGTFWAASEDYGSPKIREYRANNNLLSTALLPCAGDIATAEIIDFSSNPSLGSFGSPPVFPMPVITLNISHCAFTGVFPDLVVGGYVASLAILDVSHNAVTQVASPSGIVELYAQNNSLTTMSGSTQNTLDVYRIEFNSVSTCQSFTTVAPMSSCNLTYNLADFGPCSVPAECQTMPQSIEIPPPQAPPVDPPINPPPFDPASQSYLRTMAASIPGLQSLPAPWSTTQDMYCEAPWTGITCFESNTQLAIDISNRGLVGSMPISNPFPLQSICDISLPLLRFNISGNQITGALPTINCGFPHLTHFDVSFNRLTGPLNGGWWSAPALVYYSIRHNPLKADGQYILYDLAGIDEVYADHCELTGDLTNTDAWASEIPRETRVMDLSYNNYTGTFDGVRIRDGARIIASHNMLSSVSAYLLETAGNASLIDLSYNVIDAVRAPFNTSAYNITRLDLSHNQLAGHLNLASALAPGAATQQIDALDVSFNALERLTSPPQIYELYAQNNSLGTLNGTTNSALRVYRVDSNNVTACEAFTPIVSPMLECDLRYNYIEDTTAPSCDVPAECQVQPQLYIPPPPVAPPVDPPIDPPVDPPIEPPIEPPVEPPIEPPIEPPTESPAAPPVAPPVAPRLSTGAIVSIALAAPATVVVVIVAISIISAASGSGGTAAVPGAVAMAASARGYGAASARYTVDEIPLYQTHKRKTRKHDTPGRRGSARRDDSVTL